ncbi:transposase [Geomonas paludis]|uniref:Transposase n=1 Tax=Geomonas paludis TaxID=2740185 RepID=A0ABY4LBB2_9BACT|nr:transposase [Geomonas paludis]UPU35271.1 transposase [Geomonas paludis]
MARPLRIEFPGALYHVTSRGNEQKDVFRDDKDRAIFLDVLAGCCNLFNWLCHAYCLMGNHYHLVIETVDGTLSKGMRHLNGVYTQKFNWNHHRVDHIFQGRFKAILIERETHLLEAHRYVVLNPIWSGIATKPAAANRT